MMTNPKMTPTKWRIEQSAQTRAGMLADAIVRRLGLSYPIDPLRIAKEEHPRLRVGGRDFGDRFDGKLRYNSEKRCFGLLYNTKYDAGYRSGTHHPRTRFSIAHELGHYHLEHHHAYLTHGGKSHASINEFRSKSLIEREADAFAASLLLPTDLVKPIINAGELSVSRLEGIAIDFQTSLVSTAIRAVQLSHFPCALVGIRQSAVAWTFPSDALIEAGIYPNKGVLPRNATEPWAEFQVGVADRTRNEGRVRDWFNTYEREDLGRVFVTEEFVPVNSMGTLLVLITMDENDVAPDNDEEDYDDD
jgi:hypothetical protein